jgi:hypothetical protein
MEHTKHKYPTELPFIFPLLISAILVLLPSLMMITEANNYSRLYLILWGNWISPFILWFFAATVFYLLLKKRKLHHEIYTSNLIASKIIPTILEENTTIGEMAPIDLFKRIRDGLTQMHPKANAWNLLLSRCRLFLGHEFKNHENEVGVFEREYMDASYALPSFMIWAIPILGFIGTVWGISNGIAGFSSAMTNVDSVAEVSTTLKDTLPIVTSSLAAAFDTTFLALLLSIPLMLMMTWFEKAEDNYLMTLDELWIYELKPKFLVKIKNIVQTPSVSALATEDKSITEEIKLLSAQVGALQQTMENLYESVFASSLNSLDK